MNKPLEAYIMKWERESDWCPGWGDLKKLSTKDSVISATDLSASYIRHKAEEV